MKLFYISGLTSEDFPNKLTAGQKSVLCVSIWPGPSNHEFEHKLSWETVLMIQHGAGSAYQWNPLLMTEAQIKAALDFGKTGKTSDWSTVKEINRETWFKALNWEWVKNIEVKNVSLWD